MQKEEEKKIRKSILLILNMKNFWKSPKIDFEPVL